MITDYKKVFDTIVEQTAKYVTDNDLKAMVLGISGGIDSTVVAAICYEVSILTGVPLIGRSLPTHFNKEGETTTADLVGKAFCDDYKEVSIEKMYNSVQLEVCGQECALDFDGPQQTPIANGNIQARLRMIYLYNLAGIYKGLVMDTDNLTENNLGYFTIHGDVGDFNPIGGLWKTEVFELAAWLVSDYYKHYTFNNPEKDTEVFAKIQAIMKSLKLKPTAGLGITDSDLEELGAESYDQVDSILQEVLAWKRFATKRGDLPEDLNKQKEMFLDEQQMLTIPIEIIINVTNKHFASEFKRKQLPIKITRETII